MEPHANTSYVCLFDHGGWRRVLTLAKFYMFLPGLRYITWLVTDCNSGYCQLSEKPGYLWLSRHRLSKWIQWLLADPSHFLCMNTL